jgi:putative FmdB family regulatory protein
MPTYSYSCDSCNYSFELFSTISNYNPQPKCSKCQKSKTHRRYIDDVSTLNTSIKKSDSELKTIGDLAKRNSDRMSEDQKIHLYQKHNSYKEEHSTKELPSGMSRIKKPPKPKWTK